MRTWGADLQEACSAVRVASPIQDLSRILEGVNALGSELAVPVQVVRADRVLSEVHLQMASVHARRAQTSDRPRADDPAVAFLLFAALDRQIHRAVKALGLPAEGPHDLIVVALGRPDPTRFLEAVHARLHARPRSLDGTTLAESARGWWRERLDLDPDAMTQEVETALLARMALMALDRA